MHPFISKVVVAKRESERERDHPITGESNFPSSSSSMCFVEMSSDERSIHSCFILCLVLLIERQQTKFSVDQNSVDKTAFQINR